MRMQYRFRDVVLTALLLSCFAAGARAQQSSQQQDHLPTVSPAVHTALYPEVRVGRVGQGNSRVFGIGPLFAVR
jgi:hypothetical protein